MYYIFGICTDFESLLLIQPPPYRQVMCTNWCANKLIDGTCSKQADYFDKVHTIGLGLFHSDVFSTGLHITQ